jgi:hypothetical protein
VSSHIGFPSEPFILTIVDSAGQFSLGGIIHVSNVVRADIVVKKQFISEPYILASLRRFDVHTQQGCLAHMLDKMSQTL